MAVTELITTGAKLPVVNSPSMISLAKKAPAIGALKVAATPAAAPQPTQMRIRRVDRRRT